jgi:hypothetical protein
MSDPINTTLFKLGDYVMFNEKMIKDYSWLEDYVGVIVKVLLPDGGEQKYTVEWSGQKTSNASFGYWLDRDLQPYLGGSFQVTMRLENGRMHNV